MRAAAMFGFPATGQQVGFSEGAPDVGHRYSGRRKRGLFQRAVEGVQVEPGWAGDVLDSGPGRFQVAVSPDDGGQPVDRCRVVQDGLVLAHIAVGGFQPFQHRW